MDLQDLIEKTMNMTDEELRSYIENLSQEEKEELVSNKSLSIEKLFQPKELMTQEEISTGITLFRDLDYTTTILSDFDNAERFIHKLIENGKKRKNSIDQSAIIKLENDIKELRKVINFKKNSQFCWKEVWDTELQNCFSYQDRERIKFVVENIINANAGKEDLFYKNLYDAIIVLRTQDENNLYQNLMLHIGSKYINHWDFAYKFKKYDIDKNCYHLYYECQTKITDFIKKNDITKLGDCTAQEIIDTINKYISFIYILYSKGLWGDNAKRIIEDKENFIKVCGNQDNIARIQFYTTTGNSIALLHSKEIIQIICDTIKGPITTKLQFTPIKDKKLDDKKFIFDYLKNENSLLNAMIYGIEIAIKECNISLSVDNELNIFIYNLIKELSPKLLVNIDKTGGELEYKSFIGHRRQKKRRSAIEKFYCELNYSTEENKAPYYIVYKPHLHYYTKNDDGTYNTKNITSFVDLFGIN